MANVACVISVCDVRRCKLIRGELIRRKHGLRLRRRSRLWAAPMLLATFTLGAKCGPTQQEVGGAVLMSLPVVFGLVSLVLALLVKWWARVVPAVRLPPRQWQVPAAIVVGLALFELVLGAFRNDDALQWVVAALWVFGSSYGTFALLTFRWMVRSRPTEAFGIAHGVGLLVASPALFMALGLLSEPVELLGAVWLYTGGLGIVTSVVAAALLVEAAHRGRRQRPPDEDTARIFD